MTETNINTRQPIIMDYASPIQFRFKCTKLPLVEYYCQSANLPSVSLDEVSQPTRLKSINMPGSTLTFGSLDLSFLVDENLNNYKELHDWMIGLGTPESDTQFANLVAGSADRFPGSTSGANPTGRGDDLPVSEGGIYSDATLTILNSKNVPKTEIRFKNVYPTSLGGLSYDVQASDVDYITVSASFQYLNYNIVQISTT